MERIHPTFGEFWSALSPRHGGRPRPRATTFEALESREVLDATFTTVNDQVGYASGRFAWFDTQVNVAIYAEDNSGANYYYFDTSGTAHPTTSITPNGNGQRLIPNYTLNTFTKTSDHTYTLTVPETLPGSSYGPKSARMIFSLNKPLEVTVNADGTVNAPVPTESEFYDFIEFTYNAPNNPTGNLNINTSTIDQFGIPVQVKVDSTSVGVDALRDYVIDQYQDFTSNANDPFAVSLWPTSDKNWGTYRITNPSDVMDDATVAINKLQTETFLLNAINATDTTLHVDAAGFPTATPFKVKIFNEVIQVDGVAKLRDGTTNWTVTRGVDGTTAAPHVMSALVKPLGPAITASQTSLTVENTVGFPDTYPFRLRIGNEIVTVTGKQSTNPNGTTTWSVIRGQFDTTAVAHQQEAIVYFDSVTRLGYNGYFNAAIDALFTKYHNTTSKLELGYKPDGEPQQVWEGEVITDGLNPTVMRFTQQGVMGGAELDIYYPFFNQNKYYWAGYSPQLPVRNAPSADINANVASLSPSEMVFSCNGVFADNKYRSGEYTADELVTLANLENQIVSALNRGVALLPGYDASDPTGTWADGSKFYTTDQNHNRYAEFMHRDDISIGGLAYGFAFDDQGGHASDIGVASFSDVTITLGPWAAKSSPSSQSSLRFLLASSGNDSSDDDVAASESLSVASASAAAAPSGITSSIDAAMALLASELDEPELADEDESPDEAEELVELMGRVAFPGLRLFLSSRRAG